MNALGRALSGLAAASVVVFLAVALDVLPSATPDKPIEAKFDPDELVEHRSPAPASAPEDKQSPEPVAEPLTGFRVPLCEAPAEGSARLYRAELENGAEAHFVWCRGGYVRFDFTLDQGVLHAQRLARFPARVELPGGAAVADFDGDGVLDLLLGTSPPPLSIHRPGAGAFFVRGRKAGGYEAARALIETPVVGVLSLPAEGRPGSDFLILTRGDAPAQRPGDLFWFAGGLSPQRTAQLPLGLSPRDLVLSSPTSRSLLVALPSSGTVLRVVLPQAAGSALTKQSLSVPGVQGLLADSTGSLILARDAKDLKRLSFEDELRAEAWAEGANVGPGVVLDLDGDSQLEVLARVEGGVARVTKGSDPEAVEELELPGEVLDVSSLRDRARRTHALALVTPPGSKEMVLLVLPPSPWPSNRSLVFQQVEASEAASFAVVPLE